MVELNKLDNLPQINLPNEAHAFAIKRFDRKDNTRVHMEDFAQVLVKYPHEKYNAANYENIANILQLKLGKNKDWYEASYAHFEAWAKRAGLPWRRIKPHLDDTLSKARDLWPEALKALPMNDKHKQTLTEHWDLLHKDFRI